MFKLLKCRTGRLGGHRMHCQSCGGDEVRINSCSLRSCCVCGGPRRTLWKERVKSWALECDYLHIVFTLPHELNDLMFACVFGDNYYSPLATITIPQRNS
jgi:hypothetical protein